MITISILEKNDVIQKGDWCRPLHLCSMCGGHGDGYSFKSMYSGAPENNTKWVRVERVMPFWIGETIAEYEKRTDEYMINEYARGDLPEEHIHQDAEALDYEANLKDGVYDH